jgi:hypothetical protein
MNRAVFVGVVGVEGSRNKQGVAVVVVAMVDVAVGMSPSAPVIAPSDFKRSSPLSPPTPPSSSNATAVKEVNDLLRPRSCESWIAAASLLGGRGSCCWSVPFKERTPVDVRCRAWTISDPVAVPVATAFDPAAGIRTAGEQEFLRRCC